MLKNVEHKVAKVAPMPDLNMNSNAIVMEIHKELDRLAEINERLVAIVDRVNGVGDMPEKPISMAAENLEQALYVVKNALNARLELTDYLVYRLSAFL